MPPSERSPICETQFATRASKRACLRYFKDSALSFGSCHGNSRISNSLSTSPSLRVGVCRTISTQAHEQPSSSQTRSNWLRTLFYFQFITAYVCRLILLKLCNKTESILHFVLLIAKLTGTSWAKNGNWKTQILIKKAFTFAIPRIQLHKYCKWYKLKESPHIESSQKGTAGTGIAH